jgi:hypothetical protein
MTMTHKELIFALALTAAAGPLSATAYPAGGPIAPPGTPDTKYCLRVEPITGSLIGGVKCLTREEWAEGDVDVDEVWARDGVRVVA